MPLSSKYMLIPTLLATALMAMPAGARLFTASPRHDRSEGAEAAGDQQPVPPDPDLVTQTRWGPKLGGGLMASRGAEGWSGTAAGRGVTRLKEIPVGNSTLPTLRAKARLRYVAAENNRLVRGDETKQGHCLAESINALKSRSFAVRIEPGRNATPVVVALTKFSKNKGRWA